jgi:hypothetical protein
MFRLHGLAPLVARPEARHPFADLLDRRLRRRDARRDPSLGDDDQPVADLEQLLELLADDKHGTAVVAQLQQRAADLRRGADVDAPGRLRDDQQLRVGVDLAADDELLQVAAGQALGDRVRSTGLDVEARDQLFGQLLDRAGADPAGGGDRAGARQQCVGGERERRYGAAAEALLGNEVQAERAPDAGRLPTDRPAEQADRIGRGARVFARERCHQLLLAVARDAGDADDLARLDVEADGRKADAELRLLGQAQVANVEDDAAEMRLVMLQLRRLGADHQARQAGVGLLSRIDLAGDPARAHHGAVVAEGADLVELVADIEDRAALAGELAQRDEERLDRLRRQHRRRLVEDQQFRVGHQRANDLDPLALADRKRVHRPERLDVEAVDLGDPGNPQRDLGERERLVEPEPDVLGRGQRVEQAEVLIDHADAERARRRRRRDLHRRAVPADLAFVGPDRAVDDLHHGRLAGAVFAQHGVDLAWLDAQVDPVVGLDRRVLLADGDELEAIHGSG